MDVDAEDGGFKDTDGRIFALEGMLFSDRSAAHDIINIYIFSRYMYAFHQNERMYYVYAFDLLYSIASAPP